MDEHQQNRRRDDILMDRVLGAIERVEKMQDQHYKQTQDYRRNNDRIILSHKEAIKDQATAIHCIKDYFQEYEKKHEPALKVLSDHATTISQMVTREKFWSGVWEKTQEKVATAAIVTAIGGLCTALWHGIKALWKVSV